MFDIFAMFFHKGTQSAESDATFQNSQFTAESLLVIID